MGLFLNRVKAATATTGTGTVTLGAAASTFVSWATGGAVNGATYTYLIEEGLTWEIGTGVYTSATPSLSRTLISSSSGSLLNLAGAATVSAIAKALDWNQMAMSPFFDPLAITLVRPAAASYTLVMTTGGPAGSTVADLVNRGIIMRYPGSATGTLYTLYGFTATAIGTGDFTFRGFLHYGPSAYGNMIWGLGLRDNTGKIMSWGVRNTQFQTFRYTAITSTTPTTTTKTGGGELMVMPSWWQMRKVGATMFFEVSTNGEDYTTVFSESSTAFLGTTMQDYGILLSANAVNQVLTLSAYSLSLA